MIVPRGKINGTRKDPFAVFRFFHGYLTQIVEPGGKSGSKPLRHVDHRQSGGKVRLPVPKYFLQGDGSPGRSPHGYELIGGLQTGEIALLNLYPWCSPDFLGMGLKFSHIRFFGGQNPINEQIRDLFHTERSAGFGHHIHSTQFQGLHGRWTAFFRQRRHNDHGFGVMLHELPEKSQAIHPGHFYI